MPTYRGIRLTLHSQFDILPLPEYTLPPDSPLTATEDAEVPGVLTPFLPGSHFWLSYAIAPPVPASQFFLFKMRVDGKKVVSWCAGGEEGYEGKVVCGLFEGDDGAWVERRAFRFAMGGGGEDERGCIEVDVHRAGGRRRVARRVEPWYESDSGDCGGIELVSAGRAGPELPKRFYEFALIDPVDRPFAEFRFHCRSWEHLEGMGVLYKDDIGQMGEENALPVIEPNGSDIGEDEEAIEDIRCTTSAAKSRNSISISIHDGSPKHPISIRTSPVNQTPDRHSTSNTPFGSVRNLYRLSFPPRVTLNPTNPDTRDLPTIPRKSGSPSSTEYHPHPAYPVEEWALQTPSPIQSIRNGLKTPPLKGKGIFGVLRDWKKNLSGGSAKEKDL